MYTVTLQAIVVLPKHGTRDSHSLSSRFITHNNQCKKNVDVFVDKEHGTTGVDGLCLGSLPGKLRHMTLGLRQIVKAYSKAL